MKPLHPYGLIAFLSTLLLVTAMVETTTRTAVSPPPPPQLPSATMNPYSILGIEDDVFTIEAKTIKQTFRKLVEDKCTAEAGKSTNPCTNEKQLSYLIQAYEALIDLETRAVNYDRCGNWYCFDEEEETTTAAATEEEVQEKRSAVVHFSGRQNLFMNRYIVTILLVSVGFFLVITGYYCYRSCDGTVDVDCFNALSSHKVQSVRMDYDNINKNEESVPTKTQFEEEKRRAKVRDVKEQEDEHHNDNDRDWEIVDDKYLF
jgi:hypothetical protein